MFKVKTFAHLCSAFQTRAEVTINRSSGIINAIEAEDSSGYCFSVTLQPQDHCLAEPVKEFIRVES